MVKLIMTANLLVCLGMLSLGCTHLIVNEQAYDAYKKSRPASIEFLVVDTEGKPIPNVKIYLSVTNPNWGQHKRSKQGRFLESEQLLITDDSGKSSFHEDKCITVAIYKVMHDDYIWQRNVDDTGYPLYPVFGFSLYTAENERCAGLISHTLEMRARN